MPLACVLAFQWAWVYNSMLCDHTASHILTHYQLSCALPTQAATADGIRPVGGLLCTCSACMHNWGGHVLARMPCHQPGDVKEHDAIAAWTQGSNTAA